MKNPVVIEVAIEGREDLLYLATKAGYRLKDIADEAGVSSSVVSAVMGGYGSSKGVERTLADVTGLEPPVVRRVLEKERAKVRAKRKREKERKKREQERAEKEQKRKPPADDV